MNSQERRLVDNIVRRLVDGIVLGLARGYHIPRVRGDAAVTKPHPDALPDVLLDLVVVRVWRGEHCIKLLEEVRVEILCLLQVVRLEFSFCAFRYKFSICQFFQTLEQIDVDTATALELGHVGAGVEGDTVSTSIAFEI